MIRRWLGRFKGGPASRKGLVVVAAIGGIAFLTVRLVQGAVFFDSFMEAAGIAFAVMVLGLTGGTVVTKGDDLEEAEFAGWRMRFSVARKAVGAVERRLDAHTKATDQRLLDLEREVFKETPAGSEQQE
jgi:hypothetical protein